MAGREEWAILNHANRLPKLKNKSNTALFPQEKNLKNDCGAAKSLYNIREARRARSLFDFWG